MRTYIKHQIIRWTTSLAMLLFFAIGAVCTWGAIYIFLLGVRVLFS